MHGEHSFTWFSLIPALHGIPTHVVSGIFVGILLVITTWIARVQLARVMAGTDGGLIPDSKLTYKNFFEMIAESLYQLCEFILGHHEAPKFFPVIGSLFVFILASNILGLIPGFLPPTDNLNTTLALGVFVFVYYNYIGFKSQGIGYIKHFAGPDLGHWVLTLFIAPLIFVIEIVSHVFRPVSLSLRLRGNILGDHLVLGIFSQLVPVLLPVIFYGLGVFVAFMQAFVFCLLTMVYISLSTAHDH